VLKHASAVIKGRPLTRMAVRYINRIDIPEPADGDINQEDYIKVGLGRLPFEHGPIGRMATHVSTLLEGGKFGLILNCARIPPALIGKVSIVLDVDVYNQDKLPRNQADIWDHLEEFRVWKNRVFENLITDKARALFQ
jgi:uncharacterized protein (TIGR04255 family)